MVLTRSGKAAGVGSPVSSTLGRLRFLTEGLGVSLNIEVPTLPELPTLGAVKEFCSGLLEKPSSHPWGEWWASLSQAKRFSFAHSLFLFRKVIPLEGDPISQADSYVRKMSTSGGRADASLLAFVTKEIPRLFPRGWDRHYRSRASGLLLPVKSCLEAGRRRGGGRYRNSQLRYLRRVALGWETVESPDVRARVTCVPDGCKLRTVTVSSVDQAALKPLHDTLYDHISTQDWLLRGDAVPGQFSSFGLRKGEVYVSGDYEAATDNLSMEVSQCVLRVLSSHSPCVPKSVWDLALARSQAFLYTERLCAPQRRGQLMGTFLSFPLLCLVNYLVFRWLVPRRGVPVRVNGDDIVFRCRPEEAERWADGVVGSGLVLSKGKTLVNEGVFTLNSTLFAGCKVGCRALPFVRSKALFTAPESVSALAGQLSSLCPGFNGLSRCHWQVHFLRNFSRLVWVSQRSLTRGLGLRLRESVIRQAGLLRRERFYLSLSKEEPLPSLPLEYAHTPFPQGFASYTRAEAGLSKGAWRGARAVEGSFLLACRLYAQMPVRPPSCGDWRAVLWRGTPRFWEPRSCIRKCFERTWRRLCGPFAQVVGPGRVEERLMLPVGEDEIEQRKGLGWVVRPLVDGA
uniref:RNA-dependent RNA polymerase n=1 Tax=Verticillium dahliae magoulivirus 1 TaxID=2973838 RepID=A0A976SYF4_9VIRU|nr:RNA-dependent RNA polymerase [Verticillium dahliae magoulivirus 1]